MTIKFRVFCILQKESLGTVASASVVFLTTHCCGDVLIKHRNGDPWLCSAAIAEGSG